ncbi:MFS transporter [Rhodobacteraceae bacterium NNCM2]|nr:MFS transporter [Coraliihabitans acroporae]
MTAGTSGRTVAVILLSAGLIFVGNGLLQTMLPMRAELEGFSIGMIGILGTAYFCGFIGGCFIGPPMIRAVGHIRATAGVVAILAALVLVFPIWIDVIAWIGIRFLSGICLAIVLMVIESWLNDQATNETRGRMISLYIIISNAGWVVGQLGVNLADLLDPTLFLLIAIVTCLSVAPVALTPTREPDPVPGAGLDLKGLFLLSPVGTVGCFMVGTAEGAFWSFAPVFGQLRGLEVFQTTLLMGAFIMGGTISQWPIGMLSDNYDRRLVILPVTFATVLSGLAIASLDHLGFRSMLTLALLHGALMIPIYSLCIAHVNDNTPADKFVQVSGGLLLVYSIGAAIGPLISAWWMDSFGPGGLFVFISVVLAIFSLIIGWRVVRVRRRVLLYRGRYAPYPRTTQSVYELEEEYVTDPDGD